MAKGGNWERDVCKHLSKWLQGTEKPYIFWRGRGSGGMFTISEGEVGDTFSGDIYPVRQEGRFLTNIFSVECKEGYKEASLNKHLKYNKSDPIKSFWDQTVNDANKSNKSPMLIFKKKGYPTPWLGITYDIYNKLHKYLKDLRFIHLYWVDLPDTYFFEYKEFFDIITPDIIKEIFNV